MINIVFLGGLFIPDMSGVQASNTTSGIVAAPFVFYITWAAIYLWQVLWIAYLLTTMCRKRKGEYLYVEPDVWHPAFLVIGIAVTKSGSIDSDIISTAIYSIILVELLFWFFNDMSFLDKWTRYLLTPYLVYAFVLAGIVYVDHDMTKRNSIFSLVLTGIAGVLLIIKMAVMIRRHNNRPLLESDDQKLENNHIA